MKNKTLWVAGGTVGAILLWWFVWRTPDAPPPPAATFDDNVDPDLLPPPGQDPGAYQNTTNDTSTSLPVLDVSPPAPSNGGASSGAGLRFNTTNEAAAVAKVTSNDIKIIQDRIQITPYPRGGGPGSGSTQASRMATEKAAREEGEPVELIGVGDLVWG